MIQVLAARPRASHVTFALVFCVLLYVISNALHIGRISQWFHAKDGFEVAPFSAYLLAGLFLFIAIFLLLAHRWTIKAVAMLLVITSGAATYFINKYNVAIDSSMVLNTFHTDATEVAQLLSWGMLPYAFFLIALPVLIILRIEISFAPGPRYLLSSTLIFAISLLIAVGLLYANFNGIHRAGNVSNKNIVYKLVPINMIAGSYSAAANSLKPYFRRDNRAAQIASEVTKPGDLLVVLAIGESSRRKNFGIYGYERQDTTPRLRETPGLHLLNANARRGSTIYALREILEKDGVKLPALVARAGVPTRCLVNYTLYDNCDAVGETKVDNCGHDGRCHDEDVIPLLRREAAAYQSGYSFVLLHFGGGSHGPLYGSRHPPEFLKFRPTCDDADVTSNCTEEQLYNSYDNTILYVDHVVAESIRVLEEARVPYVFIYLSDHGESLLEDGNLFHGTPPGIPLPREQAEIPLIVKSSVPIKIGLRASYEQPDVFDSILELLSIRSPGFDRSGAFITKLATTQ
jgi:lipid A ethanolaminephosphotransferase